MHKSSVELSQKAAGYMLAAANAAQREMNTTKTTKTTKTIKTNTINNKKTNNKK